MNKVLSGERWIYIVAAILALHMFCMPFANYPELADKGPTWLGLDVSWQMTLNYANIKDLTWGKDIIYTYGPLGFLATRNGWEVSRWLFILSDIIVIANFYLIFRDFLRDAEDKFLAVFILISTTLLLNTTFGSGLSWVMTAFIYYWLYRTYKEPKNIYFAILVFFIVVSFYIKLNSGLFGIVFLLGHLANLLWHKKINFLKASIISLSLIVALWLSSVLLKVEMGGYVKGAIELVKGYADVMYLENNERNLELGIDLVFYGAALLYLVYFFYAVKKKLYHEIFYIALAGIFAVLLRKQSVLRNDPQHLSEFFFYIPLVFLFGSLRDAGGKIKRSWLSGILVMVVGLMLFSAQLKNTMQAFELRFLSKTDYRHQFSDYKTKPFVYQKEKRYIPDTLLRMIGNSTIDVFPWDSEYLIENNLNYTPRPVFQSFTTYTDYLQQVNYNAYLKKAPEYILYDYDAIDGRYPFNEEWIVNQFVAQNYSLVDTFWSNERLRGVFRKNNNITQVVTKKADEKTATLNQNINVQNAFVMKMDVAYSMKGKLRSFWLRPPAIKLIFITWDKKEYEFKTSRELLRGGIMVKKRISTIQEYIRYMQQPNTLDQITEVRIQADPEYYKTEIPVEYFN